MPELIGRLLGVIVIVVVAWFAALALIGYSVASINPFDWSIELRTIHLGLQLVLIGAYESWRRWA